MSAPHRVYLSTVCLFIVLSIAFADVEHYIVVFQEPFYVVTEVVDFPADTGIGYRPVRAESLEGAGADVESHHHVLSVKEGFEDALSVSFALALEDFLLGHLSLPQELILYERAFAQDLRVRLGEVGGHLKDDVADWLRFTASHSSSLWAKSRIALSTSMTIFLPFWMMASLRNVFLYLCAVAWEQPKMSRML